MVSMAKLSFFLFAGLSAAVYGNPASIEEYPSIVQIEGGLGSLWVQTCVGSIITSYHVLSVAHCFYGQLVDNYLHRIRRVRVGASQRGRDGEIFGVASVVNHPSFDGKGFDGDISVVRLSAPLTFGSTVQQAAIVAAGTSFPANVPVLVASWGRATQQDVIWADRDLYSIGLLTVDHAECVEKYSSLLLPLTITENMICAGAMDTEGAKIGIRDPGAPVYYNNVLVGVVSLGIPYSDEYPLVSTAVSSYTNWIVATAV